MKRSILVAASRPDVLETVPVTLRLAGVDVLLADSGLEAIRQARAYSPELALIDSELPDMDGPTVADILKRLPSTASIPTMILTTVRVTDAEDQTSRRTELLTQVAQALVVFQNLEALRKPYAELEYAPYCA